MAAASGMYILGLVADSLHHNLDIDIKTLQMNDLCLKVLFKIELFDHSTVCKQMTNVQLNC